MSEIKALEKLRKLASNRMQDWEKVLFAQDEYKQVLAIIDEIEAEIAASYLELPKDADGVPIHVGDEMTCHGDVFKVCAVAPAKVHRWVTVKLGEPQTTYSYDPRECTHYKPRTLEDVLRDVWIEALHYVESDIWRNPDEAFAERAEEIRAMFGEVD